MTALGSTTQISREAAQRSPIDPVALTRIYRRLQQCNQIARRQSTHSGDGIKSASYGPAAIACTVDLAAADTIACERWSAEVSTAAGGDGRNSSQPGPAGKNGNPPDLAAFLRMACGLASAAKPQDRVLAALFSRPLDVRSQLVLRASAWEKLPAVFIATSGMAGATLSDGAAAYESFGFPRIPVDCNDVLALYRVGHEAVDRARIGYGPTLIDCVRYELEVGGNVLAKFEAHMMRMKLLLPGESSQAARRVRSEQPTRRAASEPGVQLFIPS